MNGTTLPATKRRARTAEIAAGFVMAFVLWNLLTTPTLLGPVRVDFDWDRQSGFRSIRSVGRVARLIDPPYDKLLSNPIVTAQVRRQLDTALREKEWRSAHGQVEFLVVGSVVVLGRDPHSEISYACPAESSTCVYF